MKHNYQTDDICTSMRKHMAVMWELCNKYPSMDFYRMSGTRNSGCRITIMGSDMAEVWTEELARKKSIEPDFVGSVISNYVTAEDKARAISVAKRDYSALKNKEFGRFAYQSTWRYKWIQFARTYDDLYKIIEHVVLVYAKETESDLYIKRDEYEPGCCGGLRSRDGEIKKPAIIDRFRKERKYEKIYLKACCLSFYGIILL